MWMSIAIGVTLAALATPPSDGGPAGGPGDRERSFQTSPIDLVQTQLSLPGKLKIGKSFRVMDELENVGESSAPISVTYYYLSEDDKLDPTDVPFAGRRVPALGPGRAHSAVSPATLKETVKPGVYYVIAMADAQRIVEERYEENNTRAVKVTVEPADPPKK